MARKPDHPRSPISLTIDPERENRVRERAYLLWEADGKPHGRDVEYWERARELVVIEDRGGEEASAASRNHSGARPARAQPVGAQASGEEAAASPAGQSDNKGAVAKRKSRAKSK